MITEAAVYLDGLTQVGMTGYGPNWRQPGAFAWVSVQNPDDGDLARLHETVGVAPQAISAAHDELQRPGMRVVGDTVLIALTTGHYRPESMTVALTDLLLVVGPDFVVTVSDADMTGFAALRAELEDGRTELRGGPLALLHGVLELVIDGFATLIEDIDREIRLLEREIFAERGTNLAAEIYRLRRLLMEVEQVTGQLVDEPLERLIRRRLPRWVGMDPCAACVGEQALHEVDRRLRYLDSRVRGRRALLDGVLDVNLTQVGLRQAQDVRKIAAWVATAAAPALIAGIYGMNFATMPELTWVYGYPVALGAMVVLAVFLQVLFRKKDWL
ncbi:CorA family divalent cation transporter [Nocardia brasiliensis]|uniref:CorA family divalent cation transporter n=1 Tax=Nocardia brasiliensis TaxID=37326 RepID=UPI00245910DE|nr:CorA family divalent cation transporter [Nocardia brasiliensis]